ncbi:MAG: lamin tail domain-containing protein [Labilithrix sp.]|nr:lamin tail domain-containing protein [Labilithrix sp.]
MRRLFVLFTLASVAVWACSESTDGLIPPAPTDGASTDGADAASGSSGSSGSSGASPDPDKGTFDATTGSSSVVLINEISASDDWIELVNSSATAVDLGGWKVADSDKKTGKLKLDDAVTFPPNTKLPAGAYGLVRAGGLDSGEPCPAGDHVFCVLAEFGISNKDGESVFLLDADGEIVGTVVYPPEAASGGDTWGRIPNGDANGAFERTAATPGAPNKAK